MKDHQHNSPGLHHLFQGPSTDQRTFEQLVRETVRQLHSELRYKDFFNGFTEDSVHDFIAEYAVLRSWYTVNGSSIKAKSERSLFRFRDMALNCFWEIQQKKLFNIHAEWRAGLITLPGVAVSSEITMWEKNISACPYIEPVSQAEFNLYLSYLHSGTYAEKNWALGWQDYDTYRHCENELLPSWYRFFDQATGTDYLLMLADKKGPEEMKALAEGRKYHTPEPSEAQTASRKPELAFNYESLHYFISHYEPGKLLECFLAAEPNPGERERDAALQSALRILQSAQGAVALPEAADWKEAVIRGAADYKAMMIVKELRQVYDEYLFRLASGIAPSSTHDDHDAFQELRAHAEMTRQIVTGHRKQP
jgi:hypothetical protein